MLIATAGMGAGHLQVATGLAAELTRSGVLVETVDVLAVSPLAGAVSKAAYRAMLRRTPWLYGGIMASWRAAPGAWRALIRACSGSTRRGLADAATRLGADVVISTYNLASLCLGDLVAAGGLDAELVTLVTDPGPHPYWIHPAAGHHLVPLEITAEGVRALGGNDVVVTRPVLREEFATPPSRADARRRLGMDPTAPVVLVSAGSWAAGELRHTVDELGGLDGVMVVVLCGRDETLRRTLRTAGVIAVGWTDQVIDHLAAADVVVDNAGGQTCWEAMACATRVVMYRPLAGHGRLNALALEAAGLVVHPREAAGLRTEVRAALVAPDPPCAPPWLGHPSAAATVLTLATTTVRRHGDA